MNQYDGLLPTLTVWETIKYSALLRLPVTMTTKQKLYRAAYIMHVLEIAHIAHCQLGSLTGTSTVGGSNQPIKGISGGQRRRLSIALELLPNPSIVLLDEVSRLSNHTVHVVHIVCVCSQHQDWMVLLL